MKVIKKTLNKLPYIKSLVWEINRLKSNSKHPPGHFYSPIPNLNELKKEENRIWGNELIDGIPGIELNTEKQIFLVSKLAEFYKEIPFHTNKLNGNRYQFENGLYSYTDGIVLYSLIRHLKPKRIIEVGSGHSSALMLDTNELFFDNSINLTFIEPFPERLKSLLRKDDHEKTEIIVDKVQAVDIDLFKNLKAGDILFIDSSHVVKTGHDVNFILFEILPVLTKGVLIHFHDVFYPFEYPKNWVFTGRNWTEDYFLKAFLMYNEKFEIRLFSEYIHKLHPTAFEKMPLSYKNKGGNLWIEKK
jgi:predicted O-methyltransferase YrrM